MSGWLQVLSSHEPLGSLCLPMWACPLLGSGRLSVCPGLLRKNQQLYPFCTLKGTKMPSGAQTEGNDINCPLRDAHWVRRGPLDLNFPHGC